MEYNFNNDVITIPKKVYEELQTKVKDQKKEIEDLTNLIEQGDIYEGSSIINNFRNEVRAKGMDILAQMAIFPIGKSERQSLIYLIEEMKDFICEVKKILGVDINGDIK